MRPGRDLRDDAAERDMQLRLRRDDVGKHARLIRKDGRGRFVARGFDG